MTDRELVEPMPCPWCGDAKPGVLESCGDPFVMCPSTACNANGPECETRAEAIAAWNRVCANAARGAEVAGATEAWIDWSEIQDLENDVHATIWPRRAQAVARGEGEPCRRVLILPAATSEVRT